MIVNEEVAGVQAPNSRAGHGALRAATVFWWATMAASQWIFLYYLVAFYGVTALAGDLAAWARHPFIDGYVAGDVIGNLAFAAHVLLSIVISLGGVLQLLTWIRARAAWLHRWNGRTFIVTSIVVSLAGFYMVLFRGETGEALADDLSISLNGVLILLFAGIAWREAVARRIDAHRRWALRTLVVVNGVFFLRLIFSGWLVLTQAEPSAAMFMAFEYASFLLPLAVVELYLHATSRGGAAARRLAAGALTAGALYMCVGAFGFTMIFIRTILFDDASSIG